MQPHQERVLAEKKQLDDRRDALTSFTLTSKFNDLYPIEKELLSAQKDAMDRYTLILHHRIRLFDAAPGTVQAVTLEWATSELKRLEAAKAPLAK